MCCCSKPVINGQIGYKWQPKDDEGIRPVAPPEIEDGEEILYDEPGRCGGLDCHSHHYRLTKKHGTIWLNVRHGGGKESFRLSTTPKTIEVIEHADSDGRYWILHTLYHAASQAGRVAQAAEGERWRRAAAEKRIKTRKCRGGAAVKVWIEPALQTA